ncbi:hypothetical protein [Vibrio crassostreae]|uniref:hypothetical protein n=1 Tax=Vibrio crassostreae TaxID=246167 RepID=UPI001B309F6E|nr:hypothetical protein [Vibrio crassostreae]
MKKQHKISDDEQLISEIDSFLAANTFLGEPTESPLPRDIAEIQDSFYEDECGILSELGLSMPNQQVVGRLTQTSTFEEKLHSSLDTTADEKPKEKRKSPRFKM